jgi:Rrf2 family nitric oxide-sensitive transcriptional repressor
MGPDSACRIDRGCRLKRVLGEALDAFLAVLDRHSLQDLLDSPATLRLVAALRPI